ncbi:MAG TPA: hypothetical protein VL285_08730, partial [Bryobacteraceae bacterium]|nr:hypothetical protein [Bryobacteraceae bacterium]
MIRPGDRLLAHAPQHRQGDLRIAECVGREAVQTDQDDVAVFAGLGQSCCGKKEQKQRAHGRI